MSSDGVYTISGLGSDKWEVLAEDCSDPVTYSAVDYKDIPGLNRNRAKFIKIKKCDNQSGVDQTGHLRSSIGFLRIARLRKSTDLLCHSRSDENCASGSVRLFS